MRARPITAGRLRWSRRALASVTVAAAVVAVLQPPAQARPPQEPTPGSRQDLQARSGQGARFATHEQTGALRFFGSARGRAAARPSDISRDSTPASAARGWMSRFGGLFGLDPRGHGLHVERTQADAQGSIVRMRQTVQGLPVIGGELVVVLDPENNLLSVNGETSPATAATTDPPVTAEQAAAAAVRRVGRGLGPVPSRLTASAPELSVLDPRLLDGAPLAGGTTTVWATTVSSADRMIRHQVFVDAGRGGIVLDIDANPAAKSRLVCTAMDIRREDPSCPGGTGIVEVGSEASPPPAPSDAASTDATNAFRFSGAVYDFYRELFGRDGIDGAGGVLASTIRFCPPAAPDDPSPPPCPGYDNAFWDGSQMVYGDGYPGALDVVGHEFTHGITQHMSNLYYYYQSGAIDEALSDVMGELIQQLYGPALNASGQTDVYDPATAWTVGENLPGGTSTRRLDHPELETPARPATMRDSTYSKLYPWQPGFDMGGVHANSGPGSRTAYLIATGVSPSGTGTAEQVERSVKTANLLYQVESLLTSASGYADLYLLLPQACDLVVAKGALPLPASVGGTTTMTTDDCAVVRSAVATTELNFTALAGGAATFGEAGFCPPNTDLTDLRPIEQFDSGTNPIGNGWVRGRSTGLDQFGRTSFGNWWWSKEPLTDYGPPLPIPTFARSGTGALYGDDADPRIVDPNGTTYDREDAVIRIATPIVARIGTNVRFDHAWEFDYGVYPTTRIWNYDGGRVEYSVDAGKTWVDALPLFAEGLPNGVIDNTDGVFGPGTVDTNPLKGKRAFVRSSHGWTSSRIDLSSLNGKTVYLRWRVVADSSVGSLGWYLDNITTFTCNPTAIILTGPRTLPYGGSGTLTARLVRAGTTSGLAGKSLQLLKRAHGTSTLTLAATTTTDASGYAAWPVRPLQNYDYYVRFLRSAPFAASTSGFSIRVTPRVARTVSATTIYLGRTFTVKGSVSPSRAGKRIYLQRASGGSWLSVTSTVLSSTSTYSFTYKPSARGTASYRVFFSGDTQYGPAAAPSWSVKVV